MNRFTRRRFLGVSMAIAGAGLFRSSVAAGLFELGDSELVTLSDGAFTLPNSYWKGASDSELAALGERVTFGANVYLIRRGNRTFLIDAGAGDSEFVTNNFPTVGNLPADMADAGINPESVTDVVITHMHPDHFGGVVSNGKPAFANATIHIDRGEWAFWTRDGFATEAPEGMRPMIASLQSVAAIVKDRIQFHEGDTDLGPGINALASYGHTPGHNSFMLDLGEEQLLVLGDIVVSDHIHFANPAVGWWFDADPKAAVATRRRLLDMAASDKLLVAGNHVSAPGLGRIERAGNAYAFAPV